MEPSLSPIELAHLVITTGDNEAKQLLVAGAIHFQRTRTYAEHWQLDDTMYIKLLDDNYQPVTKFILFVDYDDKLAQYTLN
jgi:hypothetical protein